MNLKQKELHTWQNGVAQNQSIDQSLVPYGKNLGHLNPGWSNCSSLAKSMATRNMPTACSMNASPETSIPATSKPVIPSSYSQLEGNYTHGESSSPMLPKQKLVLHSSAVSRKRQPHGKFSQIILWWICFTNLLSKLHMDKKRIKKISNESIISHHRNSDYLFSWIHSENLKYSYDYMRVYLCQLFSISHLIVIETQNSYLFDNSH